MYKLPALLLLFFPLVSFLVVAVTELLATSTVSNLVRRLVPPSLGTAALALVWNPGMFGVVTSEGLARLSYILVLLASIVSCSGVFFTFSRRSSGVWMAIGGLTLVFVSLFARIRY